LFSSFPDHIKTIVNPLRRNFRLASAAGCRWLLRHFLRTAVI
jgi:hypothetical protein